MNASFVNFSFYFTFTKDIYQAFLLLGIHHTRLDMKLSHGVNQRTSHLYAEIMKKIMPLIVEKKSSESEGNLCRKLSDTSIKSGRDLKKKIEFVANLVRSDTSCNIFYRPTPLDDEVHLHKAKPLLD